MKYVNYILEDFVKDEYFQKWVLDSDAMTNGFWENWLADHPNKRELVEKARRLVLLMDFDNDKLSEKDFDGMWRHIIEKRNDIQKEIQLTQKSKSRVFLKIAAVFVGLVALGIVSYTQGIFDAEPVESVVVQPQITLELEDGTVAVLDETSSKVVTDASGKKVVSQDKNKLQYDKANKESGSLEYNVLTVPYGKKFGIVLSDGSEVYLNSGTKLRYPINFLKDAPRNVYLDGEAYFSVEKDESRPFTVITDDMNTRVYGTEFNMSSYKDENNTSTVLVEGSVSVYKSNNGEAGKPIKIKPGQRAIYNEKAILVEKANINKYIAWKDNKLLFVDDSFDLMLKELERHFNVEIENEYQELGLKKFTGTFENESLEKILEVCQEHTPFEFYKEDGKIIIVNIKPSV